MQAEKTATEKAAGRQKGGKAWLGFKTGIQNGEGTAKETERRQAGSGAGRQERQHTPSKALRTFTIPQVFASVVSQHPPRSSTATTAVEILR